MIERRGSSLARVLNFPQKKVLELRKFFLVFRLEKITEGFADWHDKFYKKQECGKPKRTIWVLVNILF